MVHSRQFAVTRRVDVCRQRVAVLVVLLSLATAPSRAQLLQRPVTIRNARILTMDGTEIENGTLVIKGDKITALGAALKPPLLSIIIDARGGSVTPGLIDANSRLGQSSAGGGSAVRRAEDAFDVYDTANLTEAIRHGVTAVYVSPGDSAGTCGIGAVVRLVQNSRGGESLGGVLEGEAALGVNLGSTSKPIARLKTFAALRKQFRDALDYRQSLEDYEEDVAEYEKELKAWLAEQDKQKKPKEGETEKIDPETDKDADKEKDADDKKQENQRDEKRQRFAAEEEPKKEKPDDKPENKDEPEKKTDEEKPKKPQRPGRKPKLDVVLAALDRDLPVRVTAHRSADILNALELADEFSLDLILEGGAEAHLVAPELASAKVPVILGNQARDGVRRDDIYRRAPADSAAALTAAGVRWIASSGGEDSAGARFVALNAQLLAARSGRGAPLSNVTAEAADILRVADQIGRLRPGLMADLVVWSGDPLDPATKVQQVFVGGASVYDADATEAKAKGE